MRDVLCSILNSAFFKFLSHPLNLSSLPPNHFFRILGLGSVKYTHRLCHRILDTTSILTGLLGLTMLCKGNQFIESSKKQRGRQNQYETFYIKTDPKRCWAVAEFAQDQALRHRMQVTTM